MQIHSPESIPAASAHCPAGNQRKFTPRTVMPAERIRVDEDGVWHVHGYDEVRQILRSELVKQAGFMSELVTTQGSSVIKNMPILFLEGEEHHRMRRETNKFFTPAITDKQYREFMNQFADGLIAKLVRKGRADLSNITMEMALKVAARVVGLTDSLLPGLNGRLNGLLSASTEFGDENPNLIRALLAQRYLLAFLFLDVKPAIRTRRRNPKNDVISYLIERGYSDIEMLTECIVYGVAGMVTTREFICVALWHLMQNPGLRQRMLVGEQEERYAILHEILRLEPIVGHLTRRATHDFTIQSEGRDLIVPAGTLLDLNLYAANTDPVMAGEDSTSVCPMRPMISDVGKVPEYVLSFGDGTHRCPGAFIAIQESDIFLHKLLAIDSLRIEGDPDVNFNGIVNGYEVRHFTVAV